MIDQKLNLYEKIKLVMKDVKYLSKDDSISFKTTKYKAISEEKVTKSVRNSLIRRGIVIFPIEQEHKKIGDLTTVDVKYKMVNVDNPVEFEIISSSGTGVDTQDKGVGKAMSYAYKYMLLRTFAIPTGEDPDKISSEELDEKLKKINDDQAADIYNAANKNVELIKKAIGKYGYKEGKEILLKDYESILNEIKKEVVNNG